MKDSAAVRWHGPAVSRLPRPRTGVPGRRQLLQLRSDSRHRTQLAFAFWGTDFLTPSSFVDAGRGRGASELSAGGRRCPGSAARRSADDAEQRSERKFDPKVSVGT